MDVVGAGVRNLEDELKGEMACAMGRTEGKVLDPENGGRADQVQVGWHGPRARGAGGVHAQLAERVLERRFDDGTFTLALAEKDVALALEAARSLGVPTPASTAAHALLAEARNQRRGDENIWAAVETLEAREVPTDACEDEWFLQLLKRGAGWSSRLTLATLSKRQGQSTLRAVAAAIAEDSVGLSSALDAWATPQVLSAPPEAEQLVMELGFDIVDVNDYLHQRRLTGHGETFSKAIVAPLRATGQRKKEREWLEQTLAELGDAIKGGD